MTPLSPDDNPAERVLASSSLPTESHLLDGLPVYRVFDDQLGMGASFGNAACWVNTRGSGVIEQLFASTKPSTNGMCRLLSAKRHLLPL